MKQLRIYITVLFLLYTGIDLSAQVRNKQDLEGAPKALQEMLVAVRGCINADSGDCSHYYKKAIQMQEEQKNEKYLTSFYCILGKYYFDKGNAEAALKDLPKGYHTANRRNEYFNAGYLANLIAAAYSYQAATDSALHYFLEARKHYVKINDSIQLAENYSNTASVYVDINDDITALSTYRKAWMYTNSLSRQRFNRFNISSNIGQAYFRLGKIDSAYYWTRICRQYIDAQEGYQIEWKNTVIGLLFADIFLEKKELDSAIIYADIGLQNAIQLADSQYIADAYDTKARLLLHQKNYKQAIDHALKSKNINTVHGNIKGLSRSLATLSESYFALGAFKDAAHSYKQQLALLDTTMSHRNIRAIREVNAKYETEKKERRLAEQALLIQKKDAQMRNWLTAGIALLFGLIVFVWQYRRGQQRKLKLIEQENENAVLKAMMNGEERERNRISKDLHDGVAAMLGAAKMSLQSIPFLSEEKKMEQLEKTAQLVSNTHADVRRIAHDLLPVTLEKEGLIAAVAQFAADINATNILNFQVNNQLPEGFVFPKNMELMLYRIIQELINNVIRHSSASEAQITFRQTGTQLEIEVSDNGIGIGDNKENQGLYSIRERLKALGGSFSIKGTERKGTRVQLLLELKEG